MAARSATSGRRSARLTRVLQAVDGHAHFAGKPTANEEDARRMEQNRIRVGNVEMTASLMLAHDGKHQKRALFAAFPTGL